MYLLLEIHTAQD